MYFIYVLNDIFQLDLSFLFHYGSLYHGCQIGLIQQRGSGMLAICAPLIFGVIAWHPEGSGNHGAMIQLAESMLPPS